MSLDAKNRKRRTRDRGRGPYRFTADQVWKMIETGIVDGGNLELWDGILYKMTKGELLSFFQDVLAAAVRRSYPAGTDAGQVGASTASGWQRLKASSYKAEMRS